MKKSTRQKIIPKLINHSSIYSLVRFSHRLYCKFTEPIHSNPSFLIIGVDKGGTSSLYDYLIQHPKIKSCVVKEPNYYAMYYDRGLSWYKSCFPISFGNPKFITGEASTQYYWYPYSAQRIYRDFPNIKLIMLLRNPIDRCYSHYNMNVGGSKENLSFEDAIEQEDKRIEPEIKKIKDDPNYFSPIYSLQAYRSKSKYIDLISKWLEFFPKEQFLFLKSEDFYHDPDKIYNQVLKFLDLPEYHLNNYGITRKGKYKKQMNSDTRENLKNFFEPFNQKLYHLLERDFKWS